MAARLALALSCLFALPGLAEAQEGGLWTLYTAEAPWGGPPSSTVRGILPMTNTVWVATSQGVGAYDGRCWRDYGVRSRGSTPGCISPPVDDARLPPANLQGDVNTAVQGPDGQIWFGTSRGVVVRQADGAWTPFEEAVLGNRDVTTILFDSHGATWFATHLGPVRVAPDDSVQVLTDPGLAKPLSLAEDTSGQIWIGTQAFGLHRYDGETWQCYTAEGAPPVDVADCSPLLPGDSNQIETLVSDRQGGLWVGTDRGLAHFDGREFVSLPDVPGAEPFDSLHALWLDPAGDLWIGVNYGLLIYDGRAVRRPVNIPFGIGAVLAIAGDAEGNVWAGTADGLWRYRSAWEPLTFTDGAIPIPQGAMAQDAAGDLWFATGSTVLRRTADRGLEQFDPLAQLASPSLGLRVESILPQPDGEIWFGSRAGAVRLEADGTWNEIELPFDEPVAVYAMVSDGAGGAWLGTSAGLGHRGPDGVWTPVTVDLPKQPVVLALLRAPDGGIWAGTSYGLMQVPISGEVRLWDVRHGLSDQTVLSLYLDDDGQLWAGTQRGADRWLGGDPAFEAVPGLEGQAVHAITQDGLGRPWFGTRRGIVVRGGPVPISFTSSDSLGLVRGLLRDRDGGVWIATASGIQQYRSGEARPWADFHLQAGNDLVLPRDGVLHVDWDRAEEVRVELDGGDLSTAFGELIFCTRMEGLDRAVTCGTEATLPYRLAPGNDYTFQVTALDKDGHSSDTVSLPVQTAERPLTQTPWFIALMAGVAAALLLFAAYWANIARKRWSEVRVQKDILLSLRQAAPGSTEQMAEVEIRHQGLAGWRWRWRALWRLELAAVKEPVEHWGRHTLPRAADLDGQLALLARRLGLRETDRRQAEQEEQAGQGGLRPLGKALLDSAFPQPLIDLLTEMRQGGKRARIRLSFDPEHGAELARLPWEYTYHPDPDLGFLAQRSHTALVRYLEVGKPSPPSLKGPLRILAIIASPVDKPPAIQTWRERARLEEALGPLIARNRVELEYLVGPAAAGLDPGLPEGSVSREALDDALSKRLDTKPHFHVLHFIGHAGPHDGEERDGVKPDEMVLYGENKDGEYLPLGRPQLVGLLSRLADQEMQPFLLFLNACQTMQLDGGQAMVGLVPELIARGRLPAVVGMQYPVGDAAATLFAGKFYEALLLHGQVDWAISIARHELAYDRGQDRPDWGMPVLYLQARNGMIFKTY